MYKELIAFTMRFPEGQRYALNLSQPVKIMSTETYFFDAAQLLEHVVAYTEQYRRKGCIHDVGGGIIMVSFTNCFMTVMAV